MTEHYRLAALLADLERDPTSAEALEALTQTILEQQIPAEQTPELIRSHTSGVHLEHVLNQLGISFWNAQALDYVIPFFQEALALNPRNGDALYNLGYVLHVLGEHELALTYLASIEGESDEVRSLIGEVKIQLLPAFFQKYKVEEVQVPYIRTPICVRLETSDPYAFRQVFQTGEYSLPALTFTPRFIIDAGANVGYASLWFAQAYPDARIVAVEPEPNNFEVLKYNVRDYVQVQCLNTGVWHRDTHLEVRDVGAGEWGTVVVETDEPTPASFPALTLSTILGNSGFEEIDILKIDIEASEKELFTYGYDQWLGRVKMIIIELHDAMKMGCSKAFFKAVNQYPFAFTIRGENVVLVREEYFYNNPGFHLNRF